MSSATALSVAVAVFFGALVIWPEMALLRRPGAETHVLRSFVLGASLAIIFGFATIFAFYALLVLQRWRWAMTSGYPSWVVADVFCDARRDAGDLINGTDDFAFVQGPERRLLLALRRARFATQVVGALVALVAVGRWTTLWLMAGGSDAMDKVARHWAMPILVAFLLFFALGIPESRVRRRERVKIRGRPSGERVPPLRNELVKMWMASAERARKSLGGEKSEKDAS